MPSLLDILGYAGNVLDLPGSSLRDLLSGNNPFDQWATPFSSDNRASGRDVLQPLLGANEETGMSGWLDNPMEGVKDLAGFGFEMAADPLNFVSMAPVFRALKGRKAAKTANKAERAASKGRYGFVNPKLLDDYTPNPMVATPPVRWQDQVAALEDDQVSLQLASGAYNADFGAGQIFDEMFGVGDSTTQALERAGLKGEYDNLARQIADVRAQNPPKLLGYTPAPEDPMFPGRELMRHGTGHDWSPSATAKHPYGMFDMKYLGKGEGNQMYGPGMYKAGAEGTSTSYAEHVANKLRDSSKLPSQQLAQIVADMVRQLGKSEDTVSRIPQSIDSFITDPGNYNVQQGTRDLYNTLKENDFLGYDIADPFSVEEIVDALRSEKKLAGWFNQDKVDLLRPFTDDKFGVSPRVYTLDVPAGTKERYLNWENPMSMQPKALQDMPEAQDFVAKIAEARPLIEQMLEAEQEASRVEKLFNKKLQDSGLGWRWAESPELVELNSQLQPLFDAKYDIRDNLKQMGIPPDLWRMSDDAFEEVTGESIADYLMGGEASRAPLDSTKRLKDAGVPGATNLAQVVSDSRNYVTWDQDLIDQFRIREIDGVRYPINPTTLVTQMEVPRAARATDTALAPTANPMSLQPLPGLAKPAMQGAAYQALARFNSYGGSL